tara:strand:+ start:816 stop:1259 length:444 start_codon:yes stop_codon:yes gene_type:complete
MSRFKLDWILNNELAIGPAPKKLSHFEYLKKQNIKSIVNLCTINEAPILEGVEEAFQFKRFTLPDHKVDQEILLSEIHEIISIIDIFSDSGPVFVHCFAAVERSPLICMAWLVVKHKLSPQRALDYLMQVHPRTNPLPSQFKLLSEL